MSIHHSLSSDRVLRFPARDERGFSLIVSLMMLIVIIILGISGSQIAINEERGSRNDRDRQIAFQAAEAALKDAEYEIYGNTGFACQLPSQLNVGNRRNTAPPATCFNETSLVGFAAGCSAPPSAGLCTYVPLTAACDVTLPASCPAYLDAPNVNFLKDAQGVGNNHTVPYGFYTGRTYTSQQTGGFSNQPISAYPPRYIIERVPKNTSFDSLTLTAQGGAGMFRVTAMGFGANANSQVVLQAVVATSY